MPRPDVTVTVTSHVTGTCRARWDATNERSGGEDGPGDLCRLTLLQEGGRKACPARWAQVRRAAEGPALLQGRDGRGARCHTAVAPSARAALTVRPEEGNVFSDPRAGAAGPGLMAAPLGGQRAVARKRRQPPVALCPQTLSQVGIWVRTLQGREILHFRDPSAQKHQF